VLERERSHYAERGWGEWATCRRETREMIGLCGLILWPALDGARPNEVEVAYLLARDAWGQGYATEAAAAIRDHAIRNLGRERLISLVYHDNLASTAVARKIGMSYEKDVTMTGITVAMYSLRAGQSA
jgi:RimJ/RimL family protein N-acetyltransferase